MPRLFLKNPYKATLQESAKIVAPKDDTCDKILGSVLTAAGVVGVASYATASAKAASLGKVAFIKTMTGAVAATVASVTVATVAGVAAITPPSIEDLQIIDHQWTECSIVVEVNSDLFTRMVTITSPEGHVAPMEHTESGQYRIEVYKNGIYQIEASGQGGRTTRQEVAINGIDDQIPVMTRYVATGDTITVYFSDELSGVQWDTVTAVDDAGRTLAPLSVDQLAGSVTFPLPEATLDIYVEDQAGNQGKTSITVS